MKQIHKLFAVSILFILIFFCSSTHSALLNLATGPILLSSSSTANVFFILDDSGSMDWEMLMASSLWEACAYDPNVGLYNTLPCGSQAFDGIQRGYGGLGYRNFVYVYRNSDNKYPSNCNDPSYNAIEACPDSGTTDWRFFSSDANLIYYNPSIDYTPWNTSCQTNILCQNASFSAARSNPKQGTIGFSLLKNLGTTTLMTGFAGFPYMIWVDDKGFTGTRPGRGLGLNYNTTSNGIIDLWDSHLRIIVGANNVVVYKDSYNPNLLSINLSSSLVATLSNTTACYNILGNTDLAKQIFAGTLSYTSTDAPGCRTITAAQQNIANWYQYARRRSLASKGAISTIVNNFPNLRYGLSVINNSNKLFVEMPPAGTTDFTTQNANLLSSLMSYEWQALGTPLVPGLEMVGKYYAGSLGAHPTSPITDACQQNFTVLLSDGYWDVSPTSVVTNDVDGDSYSVTLADVARFFYITDLSSLANEVFPSAFDPATYQHMVTFTISFGNKGNLVDSNGNGWPDPPLLASSDWGNPLISNSPAKIDDLWHAAFNSKGGYTAAQSPSDIIDSLSPSFSNFSNRMSSIAAVSQNSTILQTNTNIYRAQFNTQGWTGTVFAYPISINGIVSTIPAWSSACILDGGTCSSPALSAANNPGVTPTNRVIITQDFQAGSKKGIPFRWPTNYTNLKVGNVLPTRIVNLLQFAPYPANTSNGNQITANQLYGQRLINYLRGDHSQEVQNNGSEGFRNRTSMLGDFINSDPLYIGPPSNFYSDTFEIAPYSTFQNTYQNRTPMVAIGANDGMLHIFNALNGSELLAYVPGNRKLNKNLPWLSKPNYTHLYFVDGSPTSADILLNNNWQTVLFDNLRNGGQGLFALNISNPANFTELNASNILLWEFSDEDDADLGYMHGKIQIAKVRTSATTTQWAAIFGNGYNNTEADGFASTTGKAALYILFINQGTDGIWTADQDYIKIPVGATNTTTPNGLAEPYLVDVHGDMIVDYIYAGDLLGNMWKFDITGTSPTTWKTKASILFTAQFANPGDQPITAAPIAQFHPLGASYGIMLYFGTGKFLEPNDNSAKNQVTQSFYGIWDQLNGSVVTKNQLLQQQILDEVTQSVDTNGDGITDSTVQLRQVSNNGINWGTPNQNRGWYINLQAVNSSSNAGERQVSQPLLRGGNVIFTTLLPSPSVCVIGGSSWLMELNAANGGTPIAPPFDLNRDGLFDNSDYILKNSAGNAITVIPGGQKSTVGVIATPSVFLSPDKSKEIKVLSGSTGVSTVTENIGKGAAGRQTWKLLK